LRISFSTWSRRVFLRSKESHAAMTTRNWHIRPEEITLRRDHAGDYRPEIRSRPHLKSKLLTFPGGSFSTRDEGLRARYGAYALYRRAAEAVTVRDAATGLLDGKGKQRAVIVLGDLNDEPAAATTQILYGPPGSEIGTVGYDQDDQGDGARLWNLAARIREAERYSRIYRGKRELIDHILVSHVVSHHVGDGDVPAGPAPASIDDNPNDRRDTPASDHRPLVANIAL